jgi:putative peptidoglycan lipid II flippase
LNRFVWYSDFKVYTVFNTVFRSTLIVSLFAALGSGISFLNQLVLARYFGTTMEMDAYLVAVSLPMTIAALLSGVLNYQLVPALQRVESSHHGANALIRSLTLGLGGGATCLAVIGIGAANWMISMLNPGLSAEQHNVTVRLAHIAWVYLPLSVLGAIYM